MKRRLTLLMVIMMLLTSLLSHHVPVYAEEEGTGDEGVSETVEVTEEEQEEEDDETVVFEEDEQSEDEEINEEEPSEQEEEETIDTEGEELPAEGEEDETVVEEIAEESSEEIEIEKTEEEFQAAGDTSDGVHVSFSAYNDNGTKGIVFTAYENGEPVDVPWASAFLADDNATITLKGSEYTKWGYAYVYKNVHVNYNAETKLFYVKNKVLKYTNLPSEQFTVDVAVGGQTYHYDLNMKTASLNEVGNGGGLTFKVGTKAGTPLYLKIGGGYPDDGAKYVWTYTDLKAKGEYDAAGYPTGAHMDILDSNGNVLASYVYIGRTQSDDTYLNNFYFYTHAISMMFDVRQLIDDKIPTGNLIIRVGAPGQTAYTEKIDLQNKARSLDDTAKKLAKLCLNVPNDVEITTTDDGDLLIESNDQDFLKALAAREYIYVSPAHEGYVDKKTDYIGGGYITINGETLQNTGKMTHIEWDSPTLVERTTQYYYIDSKNHVIDDEDFSDYIGTVIVPIENINEGEIMNGTYAVELSAEGYMPKVITATLDFKNEPKEIDASKVTLSLNSNGDLMIGCSDNDQREDFFDSLVKEVKGTRINSGGHLNINGVDLYNTAGSTILRKDGGRVIVSKDALKNAFSNCLSGNSSVQICAKGYNVISKNVNFPYIKVLDSTTDNGKTLYLGVEKTYEISNVSSVTWNLSKKQGSDYTELGEDDHITITRNGNKVTLLAESFGTFRLQGKATSSSVTDSLEITVSAEGLTITAPAKAEGVVGVPSRMSATAKIGGSKDVTSFLNYRSGDESIATVDDSGNITFLSKGSVTIYASIADVEAKTVYSVYQYNKNAELTATFININNPEDVYASGMEIGEKYQMHLFANGTEVDPSLLSFKSASDAIASVDESGVVEAKKLGTVKITVSLNDFEKRSLTKSVKVINKVFYSLDLEALGVTDYALIDGVYNLFFNANSIPKDPITLKATGTDINHNQFEVKSVSYTSSDPTIVSVSSSGAATIKKAGEVTITAKVTSNPKDVVTTKDIIFRVLDLTPRISSNKVTINKYLIEGPKIYISSAYSLNYPERAREITSVSMSGDDFVIHHIAGDEYQINIKHQSSEERINALKSGTYVLTVNTKDAGGNNEAFEFNLAITVTAKKPTVTVKTTGSLNTFTNVNTLGLSYSCKDAEIIDVNPVGDWDYDFEDNTVELQMKEGKYVTSPTVRFTFRGYNVAGYIDKKVTFKTVATKPSVKLQTAAVKLYVPKESTITGKDIPIRVVKKDGINGTLRMGDQVIPLDEEGNGIVTISPVASGKIKLDYVEQNWTGPIPLTLTVTVNNTLPSAKLGSSSLTLNPNYKKDGSVALMTSIKTEEISGVEFTSGTDNLNLNYADGIVSVSLKDSTSAGTYKVTMVPKVLGDVELKPVTLTVKVVNSDPKVNVTAGMIRLNSKYIDAGNTKVKSADNLTYGVHIVGIGKVEALGKDVADFSYEDNAFKAVLKESAKGKTGSNIYNIYPKFDNGVVSSTPVRINVVLYNAKANVTVSLKSGLNQLDPSIVAEGTVKVSNLGKKVRSIKYASDVLNVSFDEESGKLSFSLKNAAVKDQTIKQAVTFVLGDNDEVTANVSVKIARKAPTVKLSPAQVVVYNSTNKGALIRSVDLIKSGTVNGQIKKVTLENVPDAYTIVSDPEDINKIQVYMKDASKIKAGLTKTVTVRIDWEGDYDVYGSGVKNLKTTTVKLTLKDISGTIKSR